jgi:PAS domain-containing protein
MILRVLRARVRDGEKPRLLQFIRDEAVANALAVPGLLSLQPAVRETRAGVELVIVSTWAGFDDMSAAADGLEEPLSLPGARSMLADAHAEHYELVLGEARAMPLREAKLRLIRLPIKPNAESAYYTAVRRWAEGLLDDSGLIAFTLGRRIVGRQDDIIAAMLWQDEAALRDIAGSNLERPIGGDQLAQFWAADPAIEHFDALTAIEPRPDAPALLVADDLRRYVHATPAAARLTGRPLARLLTMRVEDIAPAGERDAVSDGWDRFVQEGRAEGPYVLARPDGSVVPVKFAANANAPWPGSHASIVAPADDRDADDLDVDRALVEAGFVARYTPV